MVDHRPSILNVRRSANEEDCGDCEESESRAHEEAGVEVDGDRAAAPREVEISMLDMLLL